MKKMYKVDTFCRHDITEVAVVCETESTVTYRREGFDHTITDLKKDNHRCFFEDRQDAINFIINELSLDLHCAQEQLKHAERNIVEFKSKFDIHG